MCQLHDSVVYDVAELCTFTCGEREFKTWLSWFSNRQTLFFASADIFPQSQACDNQILWLLNYSFNILALKEWSSSTPDGNAKKLIVNFPLILSFFSLSVLVVCHVSAINVEDSEIWGEGRSRIRQCIFFTHSKKAGLNSGIPFFFSSLLSVEPILKLYKCSRLWRHSL